MATFVVDLCNFKDILYIPYFVFTFITQCVSLHENEKYILMLFYEKKIRRGKTKKK